MATADHRCEAYVAGLDDIRDAWERVRGQTRRCRATDFWNRYREDVALADGLGCTAFRISLAWSRLEPQPGAWDDTAFEHYRELLGAIREAGMVSVVTLHHNTWPLHVQRLDGGAGMLGDSFPDRFTDYAHEVATRLGDRIDDYLTINEPNELVYGFIKPWWMRAYPMPPGLDRFATGAEQIDAVGEPIPEPVPRRRGVRRRRRAAPACGRRPDAARRRAFPGEPVPEPPNAARRATLADLGTADRTVRRSGDRLGFRRFGRGVPARGRGEARVPARAREAVSAGVVRPHRWRCARTSGSRARGATACSTSGRSATSRASSLRGSAAAR